MMNKRQRIQTKSPSLLKTPTEEQVSDTEAPLPEKVREGLVGETMLKVDL